MIYDLINTLNILILLQSSLSIQDLSSKPTTTSSTIARLLYQPPSCPSNIAIDCGVSPCTYTPCYHPNVICRENNCGGCSAIFFDLITGQQLTDRECNTLPTIPNNNDNAAAATTTKAPVAVTTKPSISITTKAPIVTTVNGTVIVNTKNGTTSTTESEGEEGYEYEYPQQVDQYQKTRDNYGVNLNDEMIDIGRDLVNYGDLDINIAWPYTLQALSVSNPHSKIIKSSVPCTPPNKNDTNAIPCITVNTTNGTTMYYQVISTEEIGDDPVVNDYTIDNVQKTRDNMGLNLNDEVVDIGRDLINYGTLHYNMVPVSPSNAKIQTSSLSSSSPFTSPCSMVPCPISPCETAKCPLFPQATCRDDFCGGCNAIFTNPATDEDLTAKDCYDGLPLNQDSNILPIDIGVPCEPDEKICPDGGVVFRQRLNNCEFSPCPVNVDTVPNPVVINAINPAKVETNKQQLAESFIPCILGKERHCLQDDDCCGNGICDINGYCINNDIIENEKNENGTTKVMTTIIIIAICLFGLSVLLLLYCCYCKKCMVSNNDEIEARRDIFDDVESES